MLISETVEQRRKIILRRMVFYWKLTINYLGNPQEILPLYQEDTNYFRGSFFRNSLTLFFHSHLLLICLRRAQNNEKHRIWSWGSTWIWILTPEFTYDVTQGKLPQLSHVGNDECHFWRVNVITNFSRIKSRMK